MFHLKSPPGRSRGFRPPTSWFRGEEHRVRPPLCSRRLGQFFSRFLDPKAVGSLLEDHFSGRVKRRLLIWSLLSVESWCRTFLGGDRPAGALS